MSRSHPPLWRFHCTLPTSLLMTHLSILMHLQLVELTPSHCTALSFIPMISVLFLNFHSRQFCLNKKWFPLSLFRIGFFYSAHGWWEAKRFSLSKICHAYHTMVKLGTVIPYLNKTPKTYTLRDTPLEFC